MGIDLASILAGVTGIGNAMGQGTNLLQTMEQWNRYNERSTDPMFENLRNQFINQYNRSPYGPFGDPSDSFGSLFGTDQSGNPVQYGDWAARQYMSMMQNNPANAAMGVLGQGAQMQSPGVMSLSDLLSGNPGASVNGGGYTPQQFSLPTSAVQQPVNVSGIRAPSAPNPQLPQAQTPDSRGILDTLSRFVMGSDSGQNDSQRTPRQPQPSTPATPALPSAGNPWMNPNYAMPASAGQGQDRTSSISGAGNPFSRILGSYATGTPYVPQTGTYKLHEGEAVVPKVANPVAQASPTGTKMSQFPMGTAQQNQPTPYPEPKQIPQASNIQAQQYQPDINAGRMQNMGALLAPQNSGYLGGANANMNYLMANPESMGAGVQAQMFNAAADARDRMLTDQQRQIKEGLAAQGMGSSGLQANLMGQAQNARNSDLTDAIRNIYTQAATQNFQDRLNVAGLGQNQQGLQLNAANSAYQQQAGLGGLALQQQALANDIFQQDRNYNSQLASMLASLGQQGMSSNIGLMGEIGNLINSGLGYQNSALSQILQQAYQNYAGPDYAPFGYAPNDFADVLMQQNSGSNADLWGSLAGSAGEFFGNSKKPWIFGS